MANQGGRGSLLDGLRERYPQLSPQLRRGARWIIGNPAAIGLRSMREVAADAGVQPATLVRLAKTMGFEGWIAMRRRYLEELEPAIRPYSPRAEAMLEHAGARQDLVGVLFASLHRNLEATMAAIGPDSMSAAASLLEDAPKVHVAGFRSCRPIAFAFWYGYHLFRHGSIRLLGGAGATLENELAEIGSGDAVLTVAFEPYSRETALTARVARERGARLVAITDSTLAPAARHAAVRLPFSTESPSFFPSTVAAAAVGEALLAVLLARGGTSAIDSLRFAETELLRLGAYVTDASGSLP